MTTHSLKLNRNPILLLIVVCFIAIFSPSPLVCAAASKKLGSSLQPQFVQLERQLHQGRLGVFILDTKDGAQWGYRANEHFPVASTFKALLAADILKRSARDPKLMQQRIRYTSSDLVTHSPVTEKHVAHGMTVNELLNAILQHSDNTATNLLMKIVGGPNGVTQFARSIGNRTFRLDNWEVKLNTAPNDLCDTSTPKAMGRSLQRIALGNFLKDPQRQQLYKLAYSVIAWHQT